MFPAKRVIENFYATPSSTFCVPNFTSTLGPSTKCVAFSELSRSRDESTSVYFFDSAWPELWRWYVRVRQGESTPSRVNKQTRPPIVGSSLRGYSWCSRGFRTLAVASTFSTSALKCGYQTTVPVKASSATLRNTSLATHPSTYPRGRRSIESVARFGGPGLCVVIGAGVWQRASNRFFYLSRLVEGQTAHPGPFILLSLACARVSLRFLSWISPWAHDEERNRPPPFECLMVLFSSPLHSKETRFRQHVHEPNPIA